MQVVAELYRIKVIERVRMLSRSGREEAIVRVGYNTLLIKSEEVYIDPLTA